MITVRIRFEKTGEAAYISLLDLQRVFHRILKRSGLPVYYTQGFNPHIYNAAENAMVVKKTKRGQKELDLKTIIPHVEYEQAGEQLQFNLVLPCGSGEAPNYNPALLLGYLQQQYNIPPWLCSVLRTKLYTKNNEEFC